MSQASSGIPMQRSWVAALVVALLLLTVSVLAAGWPLEVRVIGPRLGMPFIDRPGATMPIRLATSLPFLTPDMTLTLEGAGGQTTLTVSTRSWDGATAVLNAQLPELPDGAYALRIVTPTQNLLAPKAVFLRRSWPSKLQLAQIADLPTPGREPLMRQFIAEMQRRKPDAVLVTGDINYGGSKSNIDFIFTQLAALDMPVIVTAGNHERESWHRYLRVFGALDHRTDLGPLTVLSIDSAHGRDEFTPSTLRWLAAELQRLGGRPAIIQLHHPMFGPGATATSEAGGTGGYLRGGRQAFFDLCRQYSVPIVLAGHWHQDAVFDDTGAFRRDRIDFRGTKYVVTTALGADAREVYAHGEVRNGYRWIEFVDGKLTAYSSDPHNPVPSSVVGAP